MKFRNNIIYYIKNQFELKEKENKKNKTKSRVSSKYESYIHDLELLKQICEEFGINTSYKITLLIENMENEINRKSSQKDKFLGGAIIWAVFANCILDVLSEYLKSDLEWFPYFLITYIAIALILYGFSLIVATAREIFGEKNRYKKLLKMLNDIKLLHYSKEKNADE